MDSDGEFNALGCFIALAFYAYITFCVYAIARKTETDNAWFAFIPLLNLILLCQIADKPLWYVLGLLVPVLNLVVLLVVWYGVAEARGKPGWVGLLTIIPGVNLIVLGYLAFSA